MDINFLNWDDDLWLMLIVSLILLDWDIPDY